MSNRDQLLQPDLNQRVSGEPGAIQYYRGEELLACDEANIESFVKKSDTSGNQIRRYWSSAYVGCKIKSQCTPGAYRRVSRWEHEATVETAEARLAEHPDMMRVRRATVEHPFGTLKAWMGSTHFLTKTLDRVSTEMSLHVLAYNLKRMMAMYGVRRLIEAMKA